MCLSFYLGVKSSGAGKVRAWDRGIEYTFKVKRPQLSYSSGRVAAVRLENICENICPEPEGWSITHSASSLPDSVRT